MSNDTQTLTLTDFLLARVTEEQRHAEALWATMQSDSFTCPASIVNLGALLDPRKVIRECEAKRRIIEFHKSWPVLVETPPSFEQAGSDFSSMTYRMTQQIQWQTEQEYRTRFGAEPPSAPMMRALATVYADHPDYRDEWRP